MPNIIIGNNLRDSRGERIWFPKDGKPYFDRSLQQMFRTPKEKQEYTKRNKIVMDGSSTRNKYPEEAGDMRNKSTRKILRMED